ncbi:MAG: hypothetical protein ABIP33_07415 [Pseudolysinimonas sp.]
MARKLTPEEIAAVNERGLEFLRKINAVPEADRTLLTSDKFAGPIAEIVVEVEDDSSES